ncbi:hypothetical protein EDC96DRAFT_498051, partial [Choanephora cucurbitarum]
MPFILSPVDNTNNLEAFKRIIRNYQHVIERNPTACCMIGFTAARMIRDVEGEPIDLEDMELWLQSLENKSNDTVMASTERFDQIEKILHMIGEPTIKSEDNTYYTTLNYTTSSL